MRIGSLIKTGDLICLSGDLGAGRPLSFKVLHRVGDR